METKAIDTANMKLSQDPGQDFYYYATGGWQENNPLTDEYSRYGSFDVLQEANNQKVRALIQDLVDGKYTGHEPQMAHKIGRFFTQGMDSNTINRQQNIPIQPYLEKIKGLKRNEEMMDMILDLHHKGVSALFNLSASPDRKNSDRVIVSLYQGGLGMNDRDYYLDTDSRSKKIRIAYLDYITSMFMLSGEDEFSAQGKARSVFEFEKKLAEKSMTRLERRDPLLTYNKMNLEELKTISSNFIWDYYFDHAGITAVDEINVAQPAFFQFISTAFDRMNSKRWRAYLSWCLINSSAPYLSDEYVNAYFHFYGTVMQGKEKIRPRWKRMVSATNNSMGEALGKLYVEKYFPPEAKQRMLGLVDNLRTSFKNRIQQLDWMSETTKAEALAKLENIRAKIGYPDKWRDYSSLQLDSEYFVENIWEANTFHVRHDWDKIGKPVDRDEWLMLPQTVNAYYHPLYNEIVFPAGILQPPFFYQKEDDAVNYGAIGVVIGHEMTHGFDDKGRQYDKDGNLNNWWTTSDTDQFNEKSKVLVDQFNRFKVLGKVQANGELTLGENIADLGGLLIALDAFKTTEQYVKNDSIDGFTPLQRFFIAYAHVWAQNIRDKEILRRVKEDVHSLGEHRVNGPLPNINEFYEAFDVNSNHSLFIWPKERARIW